MPELAGIIEDKLQATCSPEQITERHRQEGQEFVCFITIYRWLFSGTKASVRSPLRHACYANLKATHGVQVYFAAPYSFWQRGSNENANGLLREFFPKGTDFAQVTDESLQHALDLINHRPRKCLDWRTAHESFSEELSHLA